jgi:peptide methionine sulfoxide reductase MsrB
MNGIFSHFFQRRLTAVTRRSSTSPWWTRVTTTSRTASGHLGHLGHLLGGLTRRTDRVQVVLSMFKEFSVRSKWQIYLI